QVEELSLPCLGTERRSRPLGVWHAEKIEHDRQRLPQRLVKQESPPGDLVAGRSRRVVLGYAEVAALKLANRKEGYGLPVRDSVPLVDGDFARAAALGELIAQATLACCRLRHH